MRDPTCSLLCDERFEVVICTTTTTTKTTGEMGGIDARVKSSRRSPSKGSPLEVLKSATTDKWESIGNKQNDRTIFVTAGAVDRKPTFGSKFGCFLLRNSFPLDRSSHQIPSSSIKLDFGSFDPTLSSSLITWIGFSCLISYVLR